jgi:ubiquinone/menaquinone biosynthesis C-methylase UbiE
LIGVDIDPWMLRVAKSEQPIEAIRASSLALPFKDRTIGIVVSSASLKDWTDPQAGLHEIARVLSGEGVGLVYDFATTGVGSNPTGFRKRYGLITDLLRRAMSIFAPFSVEDAKTLAQGLGASASIAMDRDLPVVRITIRKDMN